MRRAFAAVAGAAMLSACATAQEYRVIAPEPTTHGAAPRSCQGGCTLTRDPADALSPDKVHALLVQVAATPVGAETDALDLLLFHDEEARAYLAKNPYPPELGESWRAWLAREFERTNAWFALRIIDEHGKVRALVPETPMALGVKLHMQVDDGDRTGPFNANGTVVRVAPDRVWIRM